MDVLRIYYSNSTFLAIIIISIFYYICHIKPRSCASFAFKCNAITLLMLLFPIVSCDVVTLLYGSSVGGNYFPTIFDQGRITGITSWGYETGYHGIIIDAWTSDSKSNTEKIGVSGIINYCAPFNLTKAKDYIDSFHVIWSNNGLVRLISFHATNGITYECKIDETYYNTLTDLESTGVVKFPGTQLTGFKFRYGDVIDAVAFQFSDLNPLITTTNIYGGYGGAQTSSCFDQGRINAITYWGYNAATFQSVVINSWSADAKSSSATFGRSGEIETNCTAFTLTTDQRIDGYRVMYDSTFQYVNSIGFQISDGMRRECQSTSLPAAVTDTSWITIYPPSYLSGFWVKAGGIIDSIVLQFTAVTLSCASGSTQVGGIQSMNDISSCGLDTVCDDRFDTNNIVQCRDKCVANANCVAYNYAPKGGDIINDNNIVCTLYDSTIPTTSFGYQIFCVLDTLDPTKSPTKNPTGTTHPSAIPTSSPTANPTVTLVCPDGSVQVGGLTANNDILGCGFQADCQTRYDTNSTIQCRDKCLSNSNCTAFNYAPIGGDPQHLNDSVCTLYDTDTQPNRTWGYQIFCDLITDNPTIYPTIIPTIYPTANPSIQPTTSNPTTDEPTTMNPTTSKPTTKDGEVETDQQTTNNEKSNGNKNAQQAGSNVSSLNNNSIILYLIIAIIAFLLCCIGILVFIYVKVNNRNKDKIEKPEALSNNTLELEKVQSLSAGVNHDTVIIGHGELQTHDTTGQQFTTANNEEGTGTDEDEYGLYKPKNNGVHVAVTKGGGNDINDVNENGELQVEVMNNVEEINNDEDSESDDNNMLYSNGNKQTTTIGTQEM